MGSRLHSRAAIGFAGLALAACSVPRPQNPEAAAPAPTAQRDLESFNPDFQIQKDIALDIMEIFRNRCAELIDDPASAVTDPNGYSLFRRNPAPTDFAYLREDENGGFEMCSCVGEGSATPEQRAHFGLETFSHCFMAHWNANGETISQDVLLIGNGTRGRLTSYLSPHNTFSALSGPEGAPDCRFDRDLVPKTAAPRFLCEDVASNADRVRQDLIAAGHMRSLQPLPTPKKDNPPIPHRPTRLQVAMRGR